MSGVKEMEKKSGNGLSFTEDSIRMKNLQRNENFSSFS